MITDTESESSLPRLDDVQLIAACRSGDAGAWEQLVRRYQRLVYTIPRRARLGDDEAADVFQCVFEKLHRNIDRLSRPERLQAWLVTTARRETLDLLRLRRDTAWVNSDDVPALTEAIDPDPLPDALLETLQENHRLRQALAGMADPCRSLLTLLYGDEEPVSYAQIAARMAMPEGSIGPTRARCLAKLRALLEREP